MRYYKKSPHSFVIVRKKYSYDYINIRGEEQRDFLDDVRRVREHSRGHDAGEVVGEVVRRVEVAVGGAVAPALPAWGTAGKKAQAPGAAAAYAAKGLYNQRHHLVALFVPRVVVVAPVEGDVTLAWAVLWSKGGRRPPAGGCAGW